MARLPNTPVIVDEFKYVPGCFIYLLTHLHTDHTGGLTPSWNNGIIFCSEITKRLLLKKFQLQEPERIIALEEGPTYYIPLVPPSPIQDYTETNIHVHHDVNIWRDPSYWIKFTNNQKDSESVSQTTPIGMNQALSTYDKDTSYMQVNIVDANHCPGSIMFLLEGYFGTVLFTGDFRYDSRILQTPCFRDKKFDHLYLDDTFLDKMYDFPSRQEAGKQVIDIIKSLPATTHVLVAVDHLGKEELMLAIATNFQSLIVVPEERYELLECMNDIIPIDLFTCDPKQGRIFVKSKKEVNVRSILEHKRVFGVSTIGIIPSGWSSAQLKDPSSQLVYRVPYSLHSSYSEIIDFVSALKPKNVYSTSKDENLELRDQVGKYCDYNTPLKLVTVPRSVLSHMERSSNMVEHKKITSVSKTNILPAAKVYRKRKSYPPSHKKLLKIIPQNTQTQNENTSIIDLTDTVNTSQINLEDTQDLLSQMYNREEKSFSLPCTPNQKKLSQKIVGSLEALDILDDFVNISPISSPKLQASSHRKKRVSKQGIEQILVDSNGIPILLPKEKNIESDEIYNLSLSPHSGDEGNGIDESEILNNIDLENSPEESIIVRSYIQPVNVNNLKRKQTLEILELSDDDIVINPSNNCEPLIKKVKSSNHTNLSQIEFSMEANPVLNDGYVVNEIYPNYSQIEWDEEDVIFTPTARKTQISDQISPPKTKIPFKIDQSGRSSSSTSSPSSSLTDIFFPKS